MSEAKEQREIVRWFRKTYPAHVQSLRVSMGGVNFGYGAKAARKSAIMKSQGAVHGEADIAILLPRGDYGALLIEHKADSAMSGATEPQLEYIRYHNSIGNKALVTKGVDMAKAAIQDYMAGVENAGQAEEKPERAA